MKPSGIGEPDNSEYHPSFESHRSRTKHPEEV
jgi:hypothetical protein